MAADYLAEGFRLIDAEGNSSKFAACLAFLDGLPSFSLYKSYVCDVVMGSGGPSLDIGCGLGFDVCRVAQRVPDHPAFGVDMSERFIEIARAEAKSRGVTNAKFQSMDAGNL